MKSALELRKSKQEKLEKKEKENIKRINLEMLELEKSFNKWESDLDDTNDYITVPIIIKTNEVKSLLKENGYIIDKLSNNIKYNTTRIYLDEKLYINKNDFANRIKNNSNSLSDKRKEYLNKASKVSVGDYEKHTSKDVNKENLKTPHTEDEFEENITKYLKNILGDEVGDIKIMRY